MHGKVCVCRVHMCACLSNAYSLLPKSEFFWGSTRIKCAFNNKINFKFDGWFLRTWKKIKNVGKLFGYKKPELTVFTCMCYRIFFSLVPVKFFFLWARGGCWLTPCALARFQMLIFLVLMMLCSNLHFRLIIVWNIIHRYLINDSLNLLQALC